MVAFQVAHGAESRFESAVVALGAVIRILLRIVKRGRHELLDRSPQCRGPVGHHFDWLTMGAERHREEPACRWCASSRGDISGKRWRLFKPRKSAKGRLLQSNGAGPPACDEHDPR